MPKERTEEQKLFHDGITVILGGKEYPVKPLTLRAEREWRQKLSKLLAELPKHAKATTDQPEEFGTAMEVLLVALPDQVVDLFFAYAKDLDRGAIEEVATGAEIAVAFQQVAKLAFPLAQALTGAMINMSQ